jgi:iron-sulfur cluster assembly protein
LEVLVLTISEGAADKIRETVNGHSEVSGLRIGVKTAGCSGYMYEMEFVATQEDGVECLERDGAQVYVDPAHAAMLKGSVLQWASSLFETGFRIENPNATRLCGCGESFDVDMG